MIHIIKLARWGFMISEASYYGYRIGAVVGPFMVLVWPIRKGEE